MKAIRQKEIPSGPLQTEDLLLPEIEGTKLVNLNSVIAQVIRQSGLPTTHVILRMDELPEVRACVAPLHQAFGLLLQYLMQGLPASGKLYCYVKCTPEGVSLLNHSRSVVRYRVELHSNASVVAATQVLHEAARSFSFNKIQLEQKTLNNDGQLLVLHFGSTGE